MTQQEINKAISWLQAVTPEATEELNSKLKSLIVWVSHKKQTFGFPPQFTIQGMADLLNKAEYLNEVQEIADGIRDATNNLVQTGVRADKSSRPIKS